MKKKKKFHGYIGKDVNFQRIRRSTGYLTGDLKRWNNAKQAEERERLKHSLKGN